MKAKRKIQLYSVFVANNGFTLVELLLALAISGMIVATIYMAYISQQRTYIAQDQVVEMQQNIRAAITILSDELRMAGYDGGNGTRSVSCSIGASSSTQPGVLAVSASRLDFSMDLNADGDCADTGENLSYYIYVATDGTRKLGRLDNNTPPVQAVAENFDGVEFLYKDASRNITTDPLAVRSVEISLLARAGMPDRRFTNTAVYCPASNPLNSATGQCANPAPALIWGPYSDNYRRRELIMEINCRNLGL